VEQARVRLAVGPAASPRSGRRPGGRGRGARGAAHLHDLRGTGAEPPRSGAPPDRRPASGGERPTALEHLQRAHDPEQPCLPRHRLRQPTPDGPRASPPAADQTGRTQCRQALESAATGDGVERGGRPGAGQRRALRACPGALGAPPRVLAAQHAGARTCCGDWSAAAAAAWPTGSGPMGALRSPAAQAPGATRRAATRWPATPPSA